MSPVAQGHTWLCEHWHSKRDLILPFCWALRDHPAELAVWGSPAQEDTGILDGVSLTDHQNYYQAEVYNVWSWIKCLLSLRRKGREEKFHYCIRLHNGKYKEDQVKLFQTLLEAEPSTNERKLTISTTQRILIRYRRKILKWSHTVQRDCVPGDTQSLTEYDLGQ